MTDDAELLRRYAETREEAAFAEIVRRHVDLVHAVTLRKVGGDAHLAQDVVQQVFADLAGKAAPLSRHPALTGWLFTSAHFAATQAVRSEQRRRIREEKAHAMKQLNEPEPTVNWESLRPLLDDVVRELGERDRTVILWRFFEGRAFREIGARLRLTEEGARSRVDRALEKMRQMLARRGVASTGTALGLALANQVCAAPAGLAASVAAAVAGGAAVSGAVTGPTLLSFMSTVKLGSSGAVALALLALSLGTNAWLWFRPTEARAGVSIAPGVTAAPQSASTPTAPGALKQQPGTFAGTLSQSASGTAAVASLVQQVDLVALRNRMRASGASEAAIRAVLQGILQRRYRERLSQDRADRLGRGWWRDPARTNGTAEDIQQLIGDSRLAHEMVTKPLEDLLGVDPAALASEDARYGFLPEETRRALGRLDRANVGGFTRTGQPDVDAKMSADFYEGRRLREEERAALLAALPPQLRTEYEMRYGQFAQGLAAQFESLDVSEAEFRTIYPLADAYAKALETGRKSDDAAAARTRLQQQMADQLIATLGYDRALDYIWAGSGLYPAYARVARDAGLPPATAGRVLQLAAETAERAAAIHADAALSVDQKREGLRTLQQAVQPQLEALVPAAAQQRLAPASLAWYTGLAEGRYQTPGTVLPGEIHTVVAIGSSSVLEPPQPPSLRLSVPRRPTGN